MVFSSLLFLFRFLPVVLLIYYVVPHRWRNLVLFLSSLSQKRGIRSTRVDLPEPD